MQEEQQLLGFQDMYIDQFPNQDCSPTPLLHSLQQNLHTLQYLNQDPLPCHLLLPQPFTAHIPLPTHPKPGVSYFCRLQSSSQLLLGSSSSHLCADSCKSQEVFFPSLLKKLMYCMNWKPVSSPDTCIFW